MIAVIVLVVIAGLLVAAGIVTWLSPDVDVEFTRRQPPLSAQTKVALHSARTRLDVGRTKADIRATSSRLRREMLRELRDLDREDR